MGKTTTRTKREPKQCSAEHGTGTYTRYVVDGPLVYQWTPQRSSKSLVLSERVITSTSTKPWPNGRPVGSTAHYRKTYTQVPISGHYTAYGFSTQTGRYVSQSVSGSFQAFIGGGDQTPIWIADMPSRAALDTKLRLKLKSEFNAAVALAEVHKAVDTIASRAMKIFRAFKALKSGNTKRALAILGNPKLKQLEFRDLEYIRAHYRKRKRQKQAAAWLEMQYGWIPLLSDVKNAVEHAKKAMASGEARVKASITEPFRREVLGSYSGSTFQTPLSSRTTISGESIRRATLIYKIDESYLNSISSVSLLNPASVAWEITPFSFVVDWFLPVGDFIDSLDATMGLTFLRGSEVTVSRVKQMTVYQVPRTSAPAWGSFTGSISVETLNRQPLGSFPTVSAPRFKNPISTTHAANALALVVSIFKK